MELDTLKELYIEELKDLYSAEQQILKSMPKMIRKASNPKLQRAFTTHMRQTERQIKRLERVARMLDESPGGKKCIGMKGLIDEVKELIDEKPEPEVLDAGLISKAQHIEHYEMAGYGTVRTYARLLGYEEQADLLQQTLDEEGATDHLLTALSESINVEAIAPEGEEEEEEVTPARKRGARRGTKRGRGTASKKRTSRRGAASRGALARHKSGNLHDRAKALIGG